MIARILVVDDEKDILDTLQDLLELEGYEVNCALGVKEALIKFHEKKPDLIMTDMMMPGMNGLHLIRAIRKGDYNPTVPIILMSAAIALLRTEVKEWDVFIKKPADIDVISNAIKKLLERVIVN